MSLNAWAQSNFDLIEQAMNGARGTPLHAARKAALETILKSGLPTPKEEEWRYSDLKEIAAKNYSLPAKGVAVTASELKQFSSNAKTTIVFVDGRYRSELSQNVSSSGVLIKSLSDYLHNNESDQRIAENFDSTNTLHERSLAPLNQALLTDGCVVIVEKGVRVNDLEILHVSSESTEATIQTPRVLIVLGERAELQLIERFVALGQGERFCCAVSELVLADGAQCDYYVISDQNDQTTHYHSVQANVSRDVQFRTHLFPFGGKLVRNEVNYNLLGQNSHSTINGLSVLKDTQHVDNSTVIRHAVPHCESSELFKGIYGDKSRGVFQGTIIVEKDAQKTNAFQSNQALLLSREASIDAKPQLKIWADDVKCTHGATVGELDSEALFYIKSRGISHEVAAALLTEAFAGELIAGVRISALTENLRERLYKKLGIALPQ